jgi:hypothetical protein
MEIYEFLNSGKHPYYKLDMKEEELNKSRNKLSKYVIDDWVTFYFDKKGNELTFIKEKLHVITLRMGMYPFTIKKEKIPYYNAFSEVLRLLNKHQLKWSFFNKYCFEKQLCIEMDSGVRLFFSFSETGDYLSTIHHAGEL